MDSEKKSKTKAPKKSKVEASVTEASVTEAKVTELKETESKIEVKKNKTKEPKVIEPKVEVTEPKAPNNGTKRKNKVGVNKQSKSKKNSRAATWINKANKQAKFAFSLANSILKGKISSFIYFRTNNSC